MRKTSQDGGDSTSITSGVEHEFKKTSTSILKTKKSSLKRKPPSNEVDETVKEPLLNKDVEKSVPTQGAKSFFKPKTETINEKTSDKGKLLNNVTLENTSSPILIKADAIPLKDQAVSKPVSTGTAPIHNYMNINIFNSHDGTKMNVTTKSQVLVEIDGSKPSVYNPSPLIFTTAKIHTDGKSKHMEPLQVTSVPILSTIEVSLSKSGYMTTNEKKISNGATVMNTIYSNPVTIDKQKDEKPNSITTLPANVEKNPVTKPISTTSVQIPNVSTTSISSVSLPSTSCTVSDNKSKDKKEVPKSSAAAELNLKSSLENKPKDVITSIADQIKPLNLPSNQAQINKSQSQTNKSMSGKSALEDHTKVSQETTKLVKLPIEQKMITDEHTSPSKSMSNNNQLQKKNTPVGNISSTSSKVEAKLDNNNSAIKLESTKVSDAKIVSSSIKQPNVSTQMKTPISNVSKDSDKSQNPSANEVKTSAPSQNVNVASSSSANAPTANKSNNINNNLPKSVSKSSTVTTSESKPIAIKSVTTTATSAISKSGPSTTTSAKVTTTTTKVPSSIAKTSSTSSTATTTKTSTNTSTALPIKTTASSVTTTSPKPLATSQNKTISSKASTTTKTSNLPVSTTTSSKIPEPTKSSTSKPSPIPSTKANASTSATPTSTAANGVAKIPEINKKGGDKTKDTIKDGKNPKA